MKLRLLILICLSSLALSAQKDTICAPECSRIFAYGNIQYGFLWTHRYNMGHLVKKHITAFELDLTKESAEDQAWHQPFHYPFTGVAIHVIPLGNPEEMGTAIGVYPFINFPLGDRDRNFKMHFRLGYGLGYITKPFDPLTNHKNVAIGSHLNCCMSMRFNGMWRLNDKNYLEFGFGMTHFSNGASKLPNLGINLPLVDFGFYHQIFANLCTKPTEARCKKIQRNKEILAERDWHFTAVVSAGFNDLDPPGGNRYALMNIQTSMMRQVARKHRWGGGIDVMYSDAVRTKLSDENIHVSVVGNLQPGAKLAYELVIGRLSFPIEMGVYIYSRYKNFVPVYNRFAVHYLAGEHLIINVSLKTHLARAEYFEYGIGWRF
ncbi:MAG TPA: acyloxyacyl hydrolase [Bacteroidia bacterium]|nr:acyloxyacyl hydrolase [Bacteroidia bacterium]